MNTETRICQNCKTQFTIEPDDFNFYEKIKVPPPTWCPECRLVRRMTFRNERTLYKRKCDLCGADKIMMYPADAPFPVYCKPCWWSDKWGAREYAREYDFSKPFFEQFYELFLAVPRCGVIQQKNSVNSEYTNRVTDMRNCYLVFATTEAENSRYSTFIQNSKECIDCFGAIKSERCYECIDCLQCYNVAFSQESTTCTDSWFLVNCTNCQDCFGCVNLRNKRYCIWNEQYTKEEYQKRIAAMNLGSDMALEGFRKRMRELQNRAIVPWAIAHHNREVSGNWIESSKNVHDAFACTNVEDARYCFFVYNEKGAMDHSHWGNSGEQIYEGISVGIQCANVRFCSECWEQLIDAEYCMNCHSSQNLFGCVGMRNARFAILNREYSEAEFAVLRDRIVTHMNETPYISQGHKIEYRYGEFFPPEFSPHAYNETIAHEFFPKPRREIEEMGWQWRESEERNYAITTLSDRLPDHIKDASEGVTKEIVGCAHGGKCAQNCTTAFRITPEELKIYQVANIPLPRLCPNCRHFERLAKRTPLRLWQRLCQCAGTESENGIYANTNNIHPPHAGNIHCPNTFETSYAPDRPEIVYCEVCYQNEVV